MSGDLEYELHEEQCDHGQALMLLDRLIGCIRDLQQGRALEAMRGGSQDSEEAFKALVEQADYIESLGGRFTQLEKLPVQQGGRDGGD